MGIDQNNTLVNPDAIIVKYMSRMYSYQLCGEHNVAFVC